MDVKTYYQRIRDTEATIATPYAVVVSRPTDDGGRPGVMVEVPRLLAAKMMVEGSAHLAGTDQAAAFRLSQELALKAAQEAAAASRFEVSMVPSEELKRLNDDVRKLKGGAKAGKD
jgi:hypothetical protein